MPQALTPRTTRNSRGLRTATGGYRATPYPRRTRTASREPVEAITSSTTAQQSATEAELATPSATHAPSQEPSTPINTPSPHTPRPILLQTIEEKESRLVSPQQGSVFGSPQQQIATSERAEPISPLSLTFTDNSATTRDSSGNETSAFRRRKAAEGERFARELYNSIRNDHFMRQCCCGLPAIYNSLEEAESGIGHLRFYTVNSKRHNLRVFQKRGDLRWHCRCGISQQLHPIYQQHIADGHIAGSRKRPATDSEFDLIAQNESGESGGSRTSSLERVIAAPETDSQNVDPVGTARVEEASVGTEQQPPKWPMWSYISDKLTTMSASLRGFVGKFIPAFVRTGHEAVETREQNLVTNQTVVKRFKRQHSIPHVFTSTGEAPAYSSNRPDVKWVEDITAYIGLSTLKEIHDTFSRQREVALLTKNEGGYHHTDVDKHLLSDREEAYKALFCIAHTIASEDGPISYTEPPEKDAVEKVNQALLHYDASLHELLAFITIMYLDSTDFNSFRTLNPEPPLPFHAGGVFFRRTAGETSRLIDYFLKKRDKFDLRPDLMDGLKKILADAKAVHKQEYPMSWVESTGISRRGTTLPSSAVFEEIPIDEFEIEPAHEVKFPEPGPSKPAPRVNPKEVKRLRYGPKPILKSRPKNWPTSPKSPKYVSPIQRKRKLAFQSPTIRFGGQPANIPAKLMTPWERMTRNDPIFNKEALARAEEKFQLQYHGAKYNGFLDGLRKEIELQSGTKKKKPEVSLHMMTEDAKKARRKYDEDMRKQYERKRDWSAQLAAFKNQPPSTPSAKLRALNKLPKDFDTPEERRKFLDEQPDVNLPIGRREPLRVNLLKKQRSQQPPLSPADRRRAIDHVLLGRPGSGQDSVELPPDPFIDDDDELEIAAKKMEHLELDRQIQWDFSDAILRQRRERRQREIEEETRRKEEVARLLREAEERKAIEEAAKLRTPHKPLIPGIDIDWVEIVKEVVDKGLPNPAPRTPDGTSLERRDFVEKLLPPTAWLNDTVITGSFDHIAKYINQKAGATATAPKCAALSSFFFKRLLSHGVTSCGRLQRKAGIKKETFFGIETILVPICDKSHWTLAVIRPQQKTVAHLDSMLSGHGHKEVNDKLLEWVRATLEDDFVEADWQAVDYDAPKQNNGYDCGVFAITNGICLALGVDPMQAYSADQLRVQRWRLAAMLLNEGFSGDFSLDAI